MEFTMANVQDLSALRATLERVTENGNPNSFALWRSAWEHGMAIEGWPHAMLYHICREDPVTRRTQVTYGWETDTDDYLWAWLERSHWHPGQDSWDDAHKVFLLVDIVRPAYIMPSIALERMLREQMSGDN